MNQDTFERLSRAARRLAPIGWLSLLAALALPAQAQQPSSAQASAIRQACRADFQAHCAGVPTGGQAALACLQQNAASLSAPCQQALRAVSGSSAAATPAQAQPAAPAKPPPAAAAAADPAGAWPHTMRG